MIVVALCLVFTSCMAQTKIHTDFGEVLVDNKDTAMFNKLKSIDFGKYKGKETSVFLDEISSSYIKRFFYEGRPGYASFLRVQYSKKLVVDIHVEKYEYMNPIDKEYKWDIEKFKKEKLFKIKLRYNTKCIKGCDEDEPLR
jgi:hypothetical protein